MKRYEKQWLPFLLFFTLLFTFAGCGSSEPINHTDKVQIPAKALELEGKNYEEVQQIFMDAGFTNIQFERLDDLLTGLLKDDGEVKEVLIDGNDHYSKSSWIPANTPVLIRFHSFKEKTKIDEKDSEDLSSEKEDSKQNLLEVSSVIMPYSSEEYMDGEWNIESVLEHFYEIGFTKIKTNPRPPEINNFRQNIFEISITGEGLFDSSISQWNTGDLFKSTSLVEIYYNNAPMITIDNCPELRMVLTGSDIDYMNFSEQYDKRYVEFDAYVINHLIYNGDLDHIIDVAGKSSDGQNGLSIRIGDTFTGAVYYEKFIDESVQEGDFVHVIGRISKRWAEYYKEIYIDTLEMYRIDME